MKKLLSKRIYKMTTKFLSLSAIQSKFSPPSLTFLQSLTSSIVKSIVQLEHIVKYLIRCTLIPSSDAKISKYQKILNNETFFSKLLKPDMCRNTGERPAHTESMTKPQTICISTNSPPFPRKQRLGNSPPILLLLPCL